MHPHWSHRTVYIIGLVAAFFFVLGGGLLLLMGDGPAYGTRLGGRELGGLSPTQLDAVLEESVASYATRPTVLIYNKRQTTTTPSELGITVDHNQSQKQIMQTGRKGMMPIRLLDVLARLLNPTPTPLTVVMDHARLSQTLNALFPDGENPGRNATLTLTEDRIFQITADRNGVMFDRSLLLPTLQRSAERLQPATVVLKSIPNPARITAAAARVAKADAERLITNAPYAITIADVRESPTTVFALDDIQEALRIIPDPANGVIRITLDERSVQAFLLQTAGPALNRSASNVRLGVALDSTMTIERPSLLGITLHVTTDNVRRLINDVLTGEASIPLTANLTPASLNEERLAELGITHLLAANTTDYTGSPRSRKHNIAVGAAIYDNILLAPGEEFSFNELLGPVGPEQGYLPELVIKAGKTIPEYGGGICQVSTTVFRAAAHAGLEITRRYPHSYVVQYYGEPGFDATIYPPNPDFRFRNDTPSHLLIQTETGESTITFEIYGSDDGRETQILGPTVYERNPDGSMKAVVRQIVTQNGETVREQAFWSNYKSPSLYPIIRNPLE